ncbi:MAG: hypothetical protein KGM47_06130 [Acidobacteriota bacterium]|nr:hypothetical protein [Acidobacteriota bacterium]
MAQSADLHDRSLPRPAAAPRETPGHRVFGALGRFLHRSIFWTYQRGSWQYDVICALIVCFIFLAPASWFHDRPTLGLTNLRRTEGIISVGHAKDGWHYIVDARLVESLAPLKAEDALRQILSLRLHKAVLIKSVVAMRGQDNVILGYTVVLTR